MLTAKEGHEILLSIAWFIALIRRESLVSITRGVPLLLLQQDPVNARSLVITKKQANRTPIGLLLAVRNYLENRREERDSVHLLSYMKIE